MTKDLKCATLQNSSKVQILPIKINKKLMSRLCAAVYFFRKFLIL